MPTRDEIREYILGLLQELSKDWDYSQDVNEDTLLFSQLGFESLDAVVLGTTIQEHYQRQMPFAELLAEIGEKGTDLSIESLVDFVSKNLGATVA